LHAVSGEEKREDAGRISIISVSFDSAFGDEELMEVEMEELMELGKELTGCEPYN
jgi:hypothetical protein